MKHSPEENQNDDGAPQQGGPGRDTLPEDAPRLLLNRLRDASLARGDARVPAARRRRTGQPSRRELPGESYAGRDPQGLGTVFGRLLSERGWNSPVAVGSVMARWAELVGPDIAAHCVPESFHETTVLVRCDSTAWATQLRLISSDLIRRFDHELGAGVVTAMTIVGPSAPSWRKGGRTVRGRGPRDTYG
ncbi:putative nucleic acid-binding Zn ribbon protein [Arthrobacter pigmenti]|uniref:Putative nucleic acid-binding Zn ribbon protein n=1 Tax=Arthrobacter pigmenti TaxID=271432 RepID=A0A846S198_9MICC|nr:putative nucleic acid-binding Zn ribbon protein [Arthrobacter pigmenti]